MLRLVFLLLLPAVAQALPPPPDSLRAVWAAAPATGPARIEALLRVGAAWTYSNDPRALPYIAAARAEARRQHRPADEGRADDLLGEYRYQTDGPALALPVQRQALRRLGPGTPPGARTQALRHLGLSLMELGRFDSARLCYRQAYALAALAPADSLVQRAEILNELGTLMLSRDLPDSATYYLYQALPRQHQRHQAPGEVATLFNLAAAHWLREQWGLSAQFARQAMRLQVTTTDTLGLAPMWHLLAALASHTPDSLRRAVGYERRAAAIWSRYGDRQNLASSDEMLATFYNALHRPDSAEVAVRRSLARYRALALTEGVSEVKGLVLLATLLAPQPARRAEAQAAAAQALALAKAAGSLADQASALFVLRDLAALRRDYREAYALARRGTVLTDSLNAKQNRTLSERLRLQYNSQQAALQIERLTRQQEVAALRLQRTLAGVLALLLAGAVLALVAVRRVRLRQQQREMALRTHLAADLHDDVGSLLTQIAFDTAILQDTLPADPANQRRLTRVADASQQAVRQLRDVVWSVDSRHDTLPSLLDRLRDYAHDVLPAANVEVHFQADSALLVRTLPLPARQGLYLIYKEALHNLVKHAGASLATVTLHAHATILVLTVDDNGPGHPPTALPQHHGLDNIRRRAQELGGRVEFLPNPAGKGWRVRLQLPLG